MRGTVLWLRCTEEEGTQRISAGAQGPVKEVAEQALSRVFDTRTLDLEG